LFVALRLGGDERCEIKEECEVKDFRTLKVWEKSHQVTLDVYKVTADFPKDERFGLVSQLRRCAASVPSNIAEGCGRRGNGEFHKFLQIATGSANELEYQILLARDLSYLQTTAYQELNGKIIEVQKMLAGLIVKVDAERFKK
jgi:four helix bundle protein